MLCNACKVYLAVVTVLLLLDLLPELLLEELSGALSGKGLFTILMSSRLEEMFL
jgi:hypothetical protein